MKPGLKRRGLLDYSIRAKIFYQNPGIHLQARVTPLERCLHARFAAGCALLRVWWREDEDCARRLRVWRGILWS